MTRESDLTHVRGQPREVAGLLDKVQTWTARLGDDGGDPWRLGFELMEPDSQAAKDLIAAERAEDDETPTDVPLSIAKWPLTWRLLPPVEMQDHHVPLPARQVWDQPAGSIGYVGRNAVRLRERLAAELKRAADFLPPLQRVMEAGQADGSVATAPERASHLLLNPNEAFGMSRDWAESPQRRRLRRPPARLGREPGGQGRGRDGASAVRRVDGRVEPHRP